MSCAAARLALVVCLGCSARRERAVRGAAGDQVPATLVAPEVRESVPVLYPAEARAAARRPRWWCWPPSIRPAPSPRSSSASRPASPSITRPWLPPNVAFSPAQSNGQPIESQVQIRSCFTRRGPSPPRPADRSADRPSGDGTRPPAPGAASPPPPQPLTVTSPPASTLAAVFAPEPSSAPASGSATFATTITGKRLPPSRGVADFQVEIGALAAVPRKNASEVLKLVPGILLTNDGSGAHADQVFLRGFDAREGQDIEFSVGGVPINESGNLHGNGYLRHPLHPAGADPPRYASSKDRLILARVTTPSPARRTTSWVFRSAG